MGVSRAVLAFFLLCPALAQAQGNLTQPVAVTAGAGLTKTGQRLDVGAGTGILVGADTVSADTTYLQRLVSGVCAAGSSIRVINSDGTVACEPDDNSGGTVTSVSGGAGVTVTNPTTTPNIAIDGSVWQARVGGTCVAGSSIRVVNSDGTVSCEVDDNTTYTASTGITLGGTNFTLSTIATARLFGNVSGSTAAPAAITGTQATTLLDTFTATLKGLVPSPGTATGTKYLSDSGTWTTPAGTNTLTNSAGANIVTKSNGTNLVASSISDDATQVSTSENVRAALSTGTATAILSVGRDTSLTTTSQNGWQVSPFSDGNNYIDSKTYSGGSTVYRVGAGLQTGANTTWLTVTNGTGATNLPGAMTLGSTLAVSGNGTFGASIANTHTMNGRLTLNADASGYAAIANGTTADVIIDIANSTPTTGRQFLLDSQSSGSFHIIDGTSGDRFSIDTSGNVAILAGTLNLSTHQIHNVVDGSSAQDAATVAQITAATTNEVTGTLTSGTVPVASGAHTLGNSSATDDGTTFKINSTKFQVTEANGNTVIGGTVSATGAVTSTAFVQGNTGVYSGANSQVYLTKGTGKEGFGCFYATNALATCKINPVGYAEGQTQFRDLDIEDGEGNSVAYYTGSTKGAEFKGAVTADTTLAVTGTSTLGVLNATGAVQLQSTAATWGNLDVQGGLTTEPNTHISDKDTSSRPTIANCGTVAPTVVGNDISGFFTVAAGATASCAITFHTAYSSNIDCKSWITGANGVATLEVFPLLTIATTGLTFAASGGPLSAGAKVHWECKDHN